MVEVPAPGAGQGQLLVRVMASLISAGTERSIVEFAEKNVLQKAMSRPDLVRQLVEKAKREGWVATFEAARNRLDTEMVLGYSNSGIVMEVGPGVTGFKVGDHVACAGSSATHSEIVRIPRNLAAVIPSGAGLCQVSFEEAAFATVASIALHGLRLADLQLGEVVAVLGLGLVGQIIVQLARANGCVVIGMDPSEERCRLAKEMGCTATAMSDAEMTSIALRVSEGRGADAVLIAAATRSDGPVCLAAEIARDRARVVSVGVVGLSLPRKPYFTKELDFRVSRSSGPGRFDPEYEEKGHDYPLGYVRWTEGRNLAAVLQLLATGLLDFAPLITHRFSIEDAVKGYDLISGKSNQPFLGVVITYPNEPSLERRVELPPTRPDSAQPQASICVGVIGAGNFAMATLLPAMKSAGGIGFGGICASGGTSARSGGSRFGFRFCTSDEADLLADSSIDTIAICTRHSSHARLAIAALNAGKHVFCEKPLAMNEDELAAILHAYENQATRRLLTVGYNRRFAPLAVQLKSFVSSATDPFVLHYRVNAGFIPADHWTQDREQGGGRILGEVCHFVDFLSFVCGQPVKVVSATTMPNSDRYSDDNVAATLEFAGGSIATITYTASGDKSFSKERLEVFVQGSVAVLDDFRELRTVRDGKRQVFKSRWRVDKGHRGEWVAFAESIRKGRPAPIAMSEIVNSTLATIALARAASSGGKIAVNSDQFVARFSGARTVAAIEGAR